MHVILGGRYQGKRSYAERLYSHFPAVSDLKSSNMIVPGLVVNVHLGVRRLLTQHTDPCGFFTQRLSVLRECVILCEEICGGIVPVDEFGRLWRDETGRVYQYLAANADIVERVFAGLVLRLKGSDGGNDTGMCCARRGGLS